MAEVTKKTTVVRKARPGYRRFYVEIPEGQAKALDQAALDDDRKGGATEMLSVLLKRKLPSLIPAPWEPIPLKDIFEDAKDPLKTE